MDFFRRINEKFSKRRNHLKIYSYTFGRDKMLKITDFPTKKLHLVEFNFRLAIFMSLLFLYHLSFGKINVSILSLSFPQHASAYFSTVPSGCFSNVLPACGLRWWYQLSKQDKFHEKDLLTEAFECFRWNTKSKKHNVELPQSLSCSKRILFLLFVIYLHLSVATLLICSREPFMFRYGMQDVIDLWKKTTFFSCDLI